MLGDLHLEVGSWADWFSGTMTGAAVVIALLAYPITKRQKRNDDRLRDNELGRAVGWKLLKVFNYTADIDRHIQKSLAKRKPLNPPGLKYPLVQPLEVPDRPLQELNQSEVDFLLKVKAADLLAEIDMCMGRYSSITYAMNEYKNRHEALYELMPPPIAREGMLFTHKLTAEENEKVGPYAAMLETLLNSIIDLVAENMTKAQVALGQYNKDMTRHFGKPLMKFEIDPAVAAETPQTG